MNGNQTRDTGYTVYQLRLMQQERIIACVYTDDEHPDDFIAGYVRYIDKQYTILEAVTPYGRRDGFFAVRNTCIIDALHDPLYAARIELLLRDNGEDMDTCMLPEPENGDYFRFLLAWAREHDRIVSVWTHDDTFVGLVRSEDDLHTTVGLLDYMGEHPLDEQFTLRELELISVGSEEERIYEQLRRMREIRILR